MYYSLRLFFFLSMRKLFRLFQFPRAIKLMASNYSLFYLFNMKDTDLQRHQFTSVVITNMLHPTVAYFILPQVEIPQHGSFYRLPFLGLYRTGLLRNGILRKAVILQVYYKNFSIFQKQIIIKKIRSSMAENRLRRRLPQQINQSNKSPQEKCQKYQHLEQAHKRQRNNRLMTIMTNKSGPTSKNFFLYLSAIQICLFAFFIVIGCLLTINEIKKNVAGLMYGFLLGIVDACIIMALAGAFYTIQISSAEFKCTNTHAKLRPESNSIINHLYEPRYKLQKRLASSEISQNLGRNEEELSALSTKEE